MIETTYQTVLCCVPGVLGIGAFIGVQLFLSSLAKRVTTYDDYYKTSNRIPAFVLSIVGCVLLIYGLFLPAVIIKSISLICMCCIQWVVVWRTSKQIKKRLHVLHRHKLYTDFMDVVDHLEGSSEIIAALATITKEAGDKKAHFLYNTLATHADDKEWIAELHKKSEDEVLDMLDSWESAEY